MFCLAFGLSMDYEVFLLSRIIEEYRSHGDTNMAVMYGLQRVGPIVTAAALIMSVVCIAMATSQVSFIKMLGVGLTLAILVDATLIRAVLMPAAMRLLGSANWWAPAPLRTLQSRVSSNTETCVSTKIPAEVNQPGEECVPARSLIATAHAMCRVQRAAAEPVDARLDGCLHRARGPQNSQPSRQPSQPSVNSIRLVRRPPRPQTQPTSSGPVQHPGSQPRVPVPTPGAIGRVAASLPTPIAAP
jgi:hypothetical protein